MIIKDFWQKIKSKSAGVGEYEKELLLAVIISLSALLAYNAGRLATIEAKKVPIRLIEAPAAPIAPVEPPKNGLPSENTNSKGQVVASKKGTKYHYLSCPGAKAIKEENKVFFASAMLAEQAGLTLAGNCRSR